MIGRSRKLHILILILLCSPARLQEHSCAQCSTCRSGGDAKEVFDAAFCERTIFSIANDW